VWTLEKTNDREGSQYRNYDAASGPILELVRVFIHEFNFKIFQNKHSHVNHTLAQLKRQMKKLKYLLKYCACKNYQFALKISPYSVIC
jgi:hypothetical protein